MIRPAANHPQREQLIRAHANWRQQRFAGTEADSTAPPWPYETEEGWPTTRRFSRTLHGVDSAWPNDPKYADPFERWEAAQIEQHAEAVALSWKWASRCVAVIAAGVAVALWRGWI
jgi:hypothetical protein